MYPYASAIARIKKPNAEKQATAKHFLSSNVGYEILSDFQLFSAQFAKHKIVNLKSINAFQA